MIELGRMNANLILKLGRQYYTLCGLGSITEKLWRENTIYQSNFP